MGGYAAEPAGVAARLNGRRLVVHEQNAVPGLAVRALRRLAGRILTGFPEAAEALGPRAQWAGIPVRRQLLTLPAPGDRYGDRSGPLRILVFGGSQRARFLNREVPPWLAAATRPFSVRHQSGEQELEAVRAAYHEHGLEAEVVPFIDDMAAAFAWADLVVCRAGAATVAELAAVGVPAVLVPYPHAVDDHQRRNAEALVSRGAALCVPQSEWDRADLGSRLANDLGDRARLAEMAEAARAFARPDAAALVADACLEESHHAA
ncbi:MAG: UDP-N-acetylglucosamine--N-acetylmuramyl-(pentapeptide) pyrophosphoryl-undecaprenol N-acetylglucosamine transferase, partial [Thiohalorhabdaceae bacterium]